MPRLVALVGMPGSGKSVATAIFVSNGFQKIYFGDLTFEKLQEEGLEVNEKNERLMRERLRAEHGMSAYAKLSIPKIERLLKKGDVVIESMYSWEEYLVLKEKFPYLEVMAIYSPPQLRAKRLAVRPHRPLSESEVRSRDHSQIEKLQQAGPIAMADVTVVNTGSEEELKKEVEKYIDGKKA
ncbi:MAG: AAA family ATPase [Candidatus Berkelbacteria bacterium]|nr:MAG: AAA family ATPase [Candidatus Berkelbacteria bacterium]QQG51471.1 MAG: AAA family ATPase [Candidatus Berkelbacteria bacterium]